MTVAEITINYQGYYLVIKFFSLIDLRANGYEFPGYTIAHFDHVVHGYRTELFIIALYIVYRVPARVPGLILSSGYCRSGVLHVLLMSLWVSSGFSGFVLPPKNMLVGGLATLNCG